MGAILSDSGLRDLAASGHYRPRSYPSLHALQSALTGEIPASEARTAVPSGRGASP